MEFINVYNMRSLRAKFEMGAEVGSTAVHVPPVRIGRYICTEYRYRHTWSQMYRVPVTPYCFFGVPMVNRYLSVLRYILIFISILDGNQLRFDFFLNFFFFIEVMTKKKHIYIFIIQVMVKIIYHCFRSSDEYSIVLFVFGE